MEQKEPKEIAALLAALYGIRFSGKRTGRFRISRKYLRQLAGRNRLSERLLEEVAEELFEYGFVFFDLESYAVVLDQAMFGSYRRVTNLALTRLSEVNLDDFDNLSAAANVSDDSDAE